MYSTTGYTYPENKICIRCLGPNSNPLYQLCDTCREGDALAEFLTDPLIAAARSVRQEMAEGVLSVQATKGWYNLELAECERVLAEKYTIDPPTRREGWPEKMPVTTHGGLLSAGHPGLAGGMFHVIEAVRQLRHECGERQVRDAEVALVHGNGSIIGLHSTAILARV